ncbi:MAG: HD domain-containing protein [Candidatus Omnitrophota bacterium]|jgi:putative hydrolase of HD superfamily
MSSKDILDFLAETGKLKQVKRSGWWMVGIPFEESVADHSFRCAVIGYILAKMEGQDPYKVLVMTLLGDLHEARINDSHKVANKYLNTKQAEREAFNEQVEGLNGSLRGEMESLRGEYDSQKTPESVIARDADILECLIQAKEYSDRGFKNAEKFFKKAPEHLATEAARKLWDGTKSWDSNEWWERLGKFER